MKQTLMAEIFAKKKKRKKEKGKSNRQNRTV